MFQYSNNNSNRTSIKLPLVKYSHTSPPSHHCTNYYAYVKNVVRITKVVKNIRKLPLRPLHGKNTRTTTIKQSSYDKNPSWKLTNILFLHKTQMNYSWNSCTASCYKAQSIYPTISWFDWVWVHHYKKCSKWSHPYDTQIYPLMILIFFAHECIIKYWCCRASNHYCDTS